ncbi:MAG: VCBS repeat-containing protein [Candidatus Eisenbacteria sp.]|nr:VCBS repeat-containing protein [Candidatus Eisenbacteria bacterium]
MPIVFLATSLPVLGMPALLAAVVLYALVIIRVCEGVNALESRADQIVQYRTAVPRNGVVPPALTKGECIVNRYLPLRGRKLEVVLLFVITVSLSLVLAEDAGADTVVDWVERDNWVPLQTGYHPGAGDLDGDLDIDLIVCDPLGAFENVGGILLPSWSQKNDSVAGIVLPVEEAQADLGDFDNDGDLDLVVGCFGEGILYFENTGSSSSPAWTRNDDYFYESHWMRGSPSAIDLDGDGDLDIAVGPWTGAVGCYWNDGTPTEPSWALDWTAFGGISPYGASLDLNFGDMDGDGDLDMITSPEAGTGVLQAYENTGSDTSAQWLFNLGMISGIPQFDDMRGGCLVDLNGDDRPDFVAYRAYGATCFRNEGPDTTAVKETSWGRVKAEFRQ